MRKISHKTILAKSMNFRNEQAIKRLAQFDSLKDWSNTPNIEIPKVQKVKVEKDKTGWYNFCQLVLNLRP